MNCFGSSVYNEQYPCSWTVYELNAQEPTTVSILTMSSHEKSSWGMSHDFWRHAWASGRWAGWPAPQWIPRSCWLICNLALFPFKVLIIELTSKVTLDSPRSYLQVKHLFTTDEPGLKPASAVSSGNKSFLFFPFLPLFLPPMTKAAQMAR